MSWVAYYADGSTFSSERGSPEETPRDLLVAIKQDLPTDRHVVTADYFVFKNNRWYGHDLIGLVSQLEYNLKDIIAVRAGYFAEDEVFQAVMETIGETCF